MHSTQENFDDIPDVDAGHDLPVPTLTTAIENTNIPTVPTEGWATFLPISHDDILTVLRYLTLPNLLAASPVNRTAQWLVSCVLIERYRTQLQGSLLWQYLPTIANDLAEVNGKAFIEYFQITTGIAITDENRPRYSTFSSCLNFAKSLPQFPGNWNSSKFNELSDLQALAKTILKDYPDDASATPRSLIEFINRCSPDYSPSQCLKLWNIYRILDAQINTLLLFIRMIRIRNTPAHPIDEIGWLIDPSHNRGLNGYGLIALNTIIPDIFQSLVREAIRLFKLENKNAAQQERLKQIEGLLDRLTEGDLLRYIPLEYDSPDKRSDDPTAILVEFPTPRPVDPQRILLIEVIQADYHFLMKKMTEAVLFKIERTDYDQNHPSGAFTVEQSRIISLILRSPILLGNLSPEGILKIFCILFSIDKVIRTHSALWPFLTFELINKWFAIDTRMTFCYAELILSNAVILKSLTNSQIIFIARHLGSRIEGVLYSAAFQARLVEDKALNGNRENKLLMELIESSTDFLYEVVQNEFVVSLLSREEILTILFPKSGKCKTSVIGFLLHKKGVISHLSSSQLLQAINDGHNCERIVAESYLTQFNHDDLIRFSENCFSIIERRNQVELAIILETLPPELIRRADNLAGSQCLTFACMHPQIGNFIINRYSNKLEDAELRSLSRHYKDNSELTQKIAPILEMRAHEKRQREANLIAQKRAAKRQLEEARLREIEQEHDQEVNRIEECRQRRESEERATRFTPHSQNNQKQKGDKDPQGTKSNSLIQAKTPWTQYLRLALFATLGLIGFALFLLGIGSALGIPIVMTMTSTLFSFLPWSAALTSVVGGYFVYLVAFVTAAVTSVDKTPEKTAHSSKKSSCSTASFFNMFDCWTEASQKKEIPQETPLSHVSFRQPQVTVGIRSKPTPLRVSEIDTANTGTFGYQ